MTSGPPLRWALVVGALIGVLVSLFAVRQLDRRGRSHRPDLGGAASTGLTIAEPLLDRLPKPTPAVLVATGQARGGTWHLWARINPLGHDLQVTGGPPEAATLTQPGLNTFLSLGPPLGGGASGTGG